MSKTRTQLALGVAILATFAALAPKVKAQTIGVHALSIHVPARDSQNNANPGLYVRTDEGLTLGVYYNTLKRTSVYLAYTLESQSTPFALTIGAVTGYQKKEHTEYSSCGPDCIHWETTWTGSSRGAVTLMLAPSVRLPELIGLTPRLSVIPRIGAASSTVIHLSLERKL